HYNIGVALKDQQKYLEAVAPLRKAIEYDRNYFPAHYNLGYVLLKQGEVGDAMQSFRDMQKVLPADHPGQKLALQQLQECAKFLPVERLLKTYLDKREVPKGVPELLALTQFCRYYKQYHATAARMYAAAFAAQPGLAEHA